MRAVSAVLAVLLSCSLSVAAQSDGAPVWRNPDLPRVELKNWPVALGAAARSLGPETNAVPSAASHFVSVVPCRVLDTRNSGSPIATNTTRTVDVPGSGCGIPAGAAAYSMSFTAMFPVDNGYLTAYPTGSTRPTTATMSYLNGGPAFDNAAIVPAGTLGTIDVYVAAQLHLIVDINGYFVEGVVTGLSAGTGMTGGGTGNVSLGIADLGVDTAQLANGAVTDTKLATITTAGKVANSATTATSANTPNTIVARDASGGFAAGALTLSGKIDQTSVDGLVASGTILSGAIPASGAGTRLMWYPGKAAFRTGYVDGAQWDDASVGDGSTAIGFNPVASGGHSTAIGYNVTASGLYSVAIGNNSTASGDFSLATGVSTRAAGGGSTAMGVNTEASGTFAIAMGRYASTTDSGGVALDGTFVWGDNSTGTFVRPTAPNQFVARSAGGARFYSNGAMSTGVVLAPGGGSWASVSDREAKTDFESIDASAILAKLRGLPITSWRYKDDTSGQRYIGPTAQDFHALFGLGTDTAIATLDTDGVTLAAVQALESENSGLREQIERLERSVERLTVAIEQLQSERR